MTSSRPRVPLPFGGGLDRDAGPIAGDSTAHEDLRGVHLARGLGTLAKGLGLTASAFLDPDDDAPMDVLIAGTELQVQNAGVVLGYRTSTRQVHVFQVTRAGLNPVHIGVWFTLASGAAEPPMVFLAEIAGVVALAHDEVGLARRARTVLYHPSVGTLTAIARTWGHAVEIDPVGVENALRVVSLVSIDRTPTLTLVDPDDNDQVLSIDVDGDDITVSLATGPAGAITSTAADVVAALLADAAAAALIDVAVSPDDGPLGDGSGVVTAMAETAIANTGLRFRGVVAHLGAYLGGWGYGTEAEPRPDFVRMSMPGAPAVFQLQHYETIGQRGDHVLACHSTGRTLLCYKTFETWDHYGTDRRTFGKRQLDKLHGLAGAHLAVNVDGVIYGWTREGPRRSAGGVPEDLSLPLGLLAPAPVDLVAEGAAATAFAADLPARNEVRFHFGRRVYVFHLDDERWSYLELGVDVVCAFLLPGLSTDTTPPGFGTDLSQTSVPGEDEGTRDVTLSWTLNDMAGDELVETWLKTGDDWALIDTVPAAGASPQTGLFPGLIAGDEYVAAVRMSRGGEYRPDFVSEDPEDWPAASTLTFIAGNPVIVLASADYDPTPNVPNVGYPEGHVHLSWTGHDPSPLLETDLYRKKAAGAFEFVGAYRSDLFDSADYAVEVDEHGQTTEFYVLQSALGSNGAGDPGPPSNTVSEAISA